MSHTHRHTQEHTNAHKHSLKLVKKSLCGDSVTNKTKEVEFSRTKTETFVGNLLPVIYSQTCQMDPEERIAESV